MAKRRNRRMRDTSSEPWEFAHVMSLPIENTFTQLQDTQCDEAPYEFSYIEMYDPSVLQASTPQLMPSESVGLDSPLR